MATVLAFANQKGGTGKTTTAVNVAAYAANYNKSVLLVDMDPQGNATSGLGVAKQGLKGSVYDVLMGSAGLMGAVSKTKVAGLDIRPSNMSLVGAELELVNEMAREQRLKDGLQKARDLYDYIFIDCPPSLGLLTVNSFAASDGIVVPMQCEYYAMEGLSSLLNTIEQIRSTVNPQLQLEGLLRTMFDPRSNLSNDVSGQLILHFGNKVYRTSIPRNIRLAEAPSFGQSALAHDRASRGAVAYLALAGEILRREEQPAAG